MALVSVHMVSTKLGSNRTSVETPNSVLGEDEDLVPVFDLMLVSPLVNVTTGLLQSLEVIDSGSFPTGTRVFVVIIVLAEVRLRVNFLAVPVVFVLLLAPVSSGDGQRSIRLQPVKDRVKEPRLLIVSYDSLAIIGNTSVRIGDTLLPTTEGSHLEPVLVVVVVVEIRGIDLDFFQALTVSTKKMAKISFVDDLVTTTN